MPTDIKTLVDKKMIIIMMIAVMMVMIVLYSSSSLILVVQSICAVVGMFCPDPEYCMSRK